MNSASKASWKSTVQVMAAIMHQNPYGSKIKFFPSVNPSRRGRVVGGIGGGRPIDLGDVRWPMPFHEVQNTRLRGGKGMRQLRKRRVADDHEQADTGSTLKPASRRMAGNCLPRLRSVKKTGSGTARLSRGPLVQHGVFDVGNAQVVITSNDDGRRLFPARPR